jgi:peptidoglycan/LPS O-acetylase OafA/YrhL
MGTAQLQSIQVLRFAAALAVIAFHLGYLLWGNSSFFDEIRPIARSGFAGVDMFFVISGFIIFMVSTKIDWSQGALPAAFGFAFRRAARIYPLYWLCFLVSTALIIAGAAQVFNSTWTLDNWTANALLFSTYNRQVPVAWTLAYEIYFYACFSAVLLFGPRFYLPALCLWAAGSVIAIVLNYALPPGMADGSWRTAIWSNALVLEFVMGVVVASLIARGYRRGAWLALIGSVPFLVLGHYGGESYRAVTFGPGAALIVYGLVSLELQDRLVSMRYVAWLGDASYSLYLWQEIPLYFTRFVFDQMGWRQVLGGAPAALAMVAACILVSLLSYRFIEKPVIAASRRRFMGASAFTPSSAANPRTSG